MKANQIIAILAIVAIVAIYIDLRQSGALTFNQTHVSSDTVIVNLPPQTINLPPGQPINITNNTVPADIDTGAILKAFFRELTYLDSLENDTVKIVLKEVIAQNSVISREISWRMKLPLSTTINNHYRKSGGIYAGAQAFVSDKSSISGNLGYMTKNDMFIFGSYDPWQKRWGAGVMMPIKKRGFQILP